MAKIRTQRLGQQDVELARQVFRLMAQVFEVPPAELSDAYIEMLLGCELFWAVAAFADEELAGGITAFTLLHTAAESAEVFVYDVAVAPNRQRQGVGRRLIAALREAALAANFGEVIVPVDNEDEAALEFYRAVGGRPSPVTFFTFTARRETPARGS